MSWPVRKLPLTWGATTASDMAILPLQFKMPRTTAGENAFSAPAVKDLGGEVKRRILLGTFVLSAGYYDVFYRKAQVLRRALSQELHAALEDFDCLLLPTTATAAFPAGTLGSDAVENFEADFCTVAANCAGLPALSFPCGMTAEGLPIGAQLVGRPFEDPFSPEPCVAI